MNLINTKVLLTIIITTIFLMIFWILIIHKIYKNNNKENYITLKQLNSKLNIILFINLLPYIIGLIILIISLFILLNTI